MTFLFLIVLFLSPNVKADSPQLDIAKFDRLFAEYEKAVQESLKVEKEKANVLQSVEEKLFAKKTTLEKISAGLKETKERFITANCENASWQRGHNDARAFNDQIGKMLFYMASSCAQDKIPVPEYDALVPVVPYGAKRKCNDGPDGGCDFQIEVNNDDVANLPISVYRSKLVKDYSKLSRDSRHTVKAGSSSTKAKASR